MSLLMDGLGMPVVLFIAFFLAITAILWLLLPFLIFGIKSKLDEQLRVLRSVDRNLERLLITSTASRKPPDRDPELGSAQQMADSTARQDDQAVPEPPTPDVDQASRNAADRWKKPSPEP